MRIKNREIAEKLGISTTAVSLALNNRPGVSDETRRKVFELVEESNRKLAEDAGLAARQTVPAAEVSHEPLPPAYAAAPLYSGSAQASAPLSSAGPAGTILLCVHKTHGEVINDKPFFLELPEHIQAEAMKNNYMISLTHFMPGQDKDVYFNYIGNLKFDGIIIVATELLREDLKRYEAFGKPIVLSDGYVDLEPVDAVTLDDQTAIFRAFDYAYQMGHRDIGFLKSSVFIQNFGHHFDGFHKGIREYGLENYNHPVIELPCSIDGAYQAMKEFLAAPPKGFKMPTIFLADLDFLAIGAMNALKEAGYRIPEDISMIGYDDVLAARYSDPPLTTTHVNHGDIGRLSTQRMIQRLKEPGSFYSVTTISSELVIRESVKKLN